MAPPLKGKGKSISDTKSMTSATLESKFETVTKSRKRHGGPTTRESAKRKKTIDADFDAIAAPTNQVAESKAKSFKLQARISKKFHS